MGQRFLFVFNPRAGAGTVGRRLKKVVKALRKRGDDAVLRETTGPGDATRWASQAVTEGFDVVVAVGGDGTLHEAAAGLRGTSTPLGLIPGGTGNVFAKEMGFPRRAKALAKILRRTEASWLDVGLADNVPFLLMASAGFDAFSLDLMKAHRWKRRWGTMAYAWAALTAILQYRPQTIRVRVDGHEDEGTYLLVSNTRLYGAFFVMSPQADPADGLLDVLVYRGRGRAGLVVLLFRLFWHLLWDRRQKSSSPLLERHGRYRCRRVEVTSVPLSTWQADGEVRHDPVRVFSVLPRAVRILLPKRAARRFQSQ